MMEIKQKKAKEEILWI